MDSSFLRSWLEKRGVSEETQSSFNIHTDGEKIIIPIVGKNGKQIFNKYRKSPLDTSTNGKKYFYDYGFKAQPYGLYQLLQTETNTVVITEGELDCLLLWSHNIPAISSTGGAGTWKNEWWEYIKDKKIIVVYDNDEAGGRGMARMWSMRPDIYLVFVPSDVGIKDLTDYHERGFDVRQLIDTAYQLPTVPDVLEDMKKRIACLEQVHFHKQVTAQESKKIRDTYAPRTEEEDNEIARARLVPIPSITTMFDKSDKALCPFHKEKTNSFTYFQKTNTCYCFGCNTFKDAIDMFRYEHKCSFRDAVTNLNKLI